MTRIQGDRALGGDGEDKLGFGPTADLLAEALAVGTSSDGLVVGVTGRWGSGKSSLINLTQAALGRRADGDRPHVIEFKPWLVGTRDALLQAMFAELVAGIDQIELEAGNATGVTIRKAQGVERGRPRPRRTTLDRRQCLPLYPGARSYLRLGAEGFTIEHPAATALEELPEVSPEANRALWQYHTAGSFSRGFGHEKYL